MDKPARRPHSDPPEGDGSCTASSHWLIWAFVFIFIIYPLSIGPTGLLQLYFPELETPRSILYAPLQLLADIYPPALDFFRWYIDWWLNLTP